MIDDAIFQDYYFLAFGLLHKELEDLSDDACSYHPIRNEYWEQVPEGLYNSCDGARLVEDYLKVLENKIEIIISQNSIAYWIHLLRRIGCTLAKCGDDRERSSVVGLVRCIFEASIQKYGIIEPCNRIGVSSELKIEEILDGFFVKNDLEEFGKLHIKNPQLVLTKFGLNELKEFYLLEKLVFEVWRSAANLRGLNKGASWLVEHNPGDTFEERDDIVRESINIFDKRFAMDFEAQFTAKGTLHELDGEDDRYFDLVYVPTYNVEQVSTKSILNKFFKIFSNSHEILKNEISTNFIWMPINLRNYYKSNLYYSKAFQKKNIVNFESVMVVLASVLVMVANNWNEPQKMLRYWQRGYEGPYIKDNIYELLRSYLPICIQIFDFKEDLIDFEKGIDFWTLNDEMRDMIDLSYPGPHSIFLPYGEDRVFIDYAWINRRLFDLFWNCKIDDERFKGTTLELLIQKQDDLVLPSTPCFSFDGDNRQIDASFDKDDILLIIECKANSQSIAFDRGTKEALRFREKKYDKGIFEIDEKAEWLIKQIRGTNFDINKYNKIIPLVVTPFKEYIRTDKRKYWLSEKIPRIITPSELIELLNNDELWNTTENALFIDCDGVNTIEK